MRKQRSTWLAIAMLALFLFPPLTPSAMAQMEEPNGTNGCVPTCPPCEDVCAATTDATFNFCYVGKFEGEEVGQIVLRYKICPLYACTATDMLTMSYCLPGLDCLEGVEWTDALVSATAYVEGGASIEGSYVTSEETNCPEAILFEGLEALEFDQGGCAFVDVVLDNSNLPQGWSFDDNGCGLVRTESSAPGLGYACVIGPSCLPPPEGDQGCSPGYWKNNEEAWELTDYAPTDTVADVFTLPPELEEDFTGDTLLDALQYGGGRGLVGKARNLLRMAVASLLNITHPDVDFPYFTEASLINEVNAALVSGEASTEILKDDLDEYNNLDCPLEASN